MTINEIKKNLNFELGAKISSFEIPTNIPIKPLKEADLDERLLNGLIDILSFNKTTIEIEGYYHSDKVVIDIPLTERFLKTFGHPLLTVNCCRDETLGMELYGFIRNLIGSRDTLPHFLRLHVYTHNLSDEELETQGKLPYHSIDLTAFDRRAQVIGASTYLEAMANKVSRDSLSKPKARESWRKRLRNKETKGKPYKPDFFDHISHLKDNKVLSDNICQALHKLRLARNTSAHNYEIYTKGDSATPFDYIRVTQLDDEFIEKATDFVRTCKKMYGAVPKAYGKNKFKRYTELLAGDINKIAKVESVHVLGLQYSKPLEEIFG